MAEESGSVSAAFTLNVTVHGLGMVVPDRKTGTVHVLFPPTEHFGAHRHLCTVVCAIADDTNPGTMPAQIVFRNRPSAEFVATGSFFSLGMPTGGPNSATLPLDPEKVVNLSNWAGLVPRRFLDSTDPQVLAGAVRFGSGTGTFDAETLEWEFKREAPRKRWAMATRLNWTTAVSAPINIMLGGALRTLRPSAAGNDVTIDIIHSIANDMPSHPAPSESSLRDYPIGYHPHHLEAYEHFLQYSPVPTLQTYVPRGVAADWSIKGIHPVTCTLGAGDPEP